MTWPKRKSYNTRRQLGCLQINLHHAKAASDVLTRRFNQELLDVAFIQEPWVRKGVIQGLQSANGKLIYAANKDRPRAALLINNQLTFIPISQFITEDLVAIWVKVPTSKGEHEVVLASAYLPGDEVTAPTREVIALVEYCQQKRLRWILCCDANAHHTAWWSTNINPRGEYLLEFLLRYNISILNRGNEPTFINAIRGEVLDITLSSHNVLSEVSNWHVSEETSMSDHRHIRFDIGATKPQMTIYRNPRKTNWDYFHFYLEQSVNCSKRHIQLISELEFESNELHSNIISAFHESCPVKVKKPQRNVPWWNSTLSNLRKETRTLWNRAKAMGDWSSYSTALTNYNKELRKSKRATWRNHCEKICSLPDAIRIQKALLKDHSNGISTLKKPDGSYTRNPEETSQLLLDTHFPGSLVLDEISVPAETTTSAGAENLKLANKLFHEKRVQWAISTFSPYKSPGPDGIFPCLLQQGAHHIIPNLTRLYKASLLLGYLPTKWAEVKVVFIPKVGKKPEQLPKSYRPISLSSFFLKTMEKIVDQYIREYNLAKFPLHRLQFAYQQGKSTETAIHSLVTVIEKAIESKQIALCAFIDISGAFDNTSYEAIYNALYLKEVPEPITRWIIFMLKSRTISTELGGTIKSIKATRGCPQGGVLSPLLWTLVIDELLHKLNNLGFHTQGYADDLVVYVLGWHEETISDRMQQALTIINKWCTEKGLSINPSKTTLVPFTRRRNINLKCPTLNGTTLQLSTEANYLGVSLDKTLTWNSHIERVTSKATRAFFACTRLFGKTWGLNPRMTFWTFTTVVKPIVTYASLAWWPKVKQRKAANELSKLHRLVCVGITGAMKTCPTDALGVLLNIPPLPILIEREARSSALRLKGISELKSGDMKGHLKILEDFLHSPILHRDDILSPKPILFRNFQVIINERTDWRTNSITFKPGSQLWFTDGSKLENGRTGAGINGPKFKKSIPMGSYPTIFQAEIHAIEICVRECLRRKMRGTHIYILSDSQAALKALLSTTITSKLVNDCLNLLNTLGNLNTVTLCWIPGHEGHEGNEMADDLAKQGANMQLTGPEPFCGLTKGHINEFLRKWEERKLAAHWLNCAGQRQAKLFLSPNKGISDKLLSLNRVDLRLLTGYLTGHCSLRYHLNNIGLSETNVCRFCEMDIESSEHVLCECPALGRQRLHHLGGIVVSPCNLWNNKPKIVLKFLKSLKL